MCFIFLCNSRAQDCQGLVAFHQFFIFLPALCGFALQVRRGAIGAQCGLVFAYNGASEKFHAEEHFKRFESYDKWKLREFKQFLKTRYKWIFAMHTWERNVVFDRFAMPLELLSAVPSDLKMEHHLIVV